MGRVVSIFRDVMFFRLRHERSILRYGHDLECSVILDLKEFVAQGLQTTCMSYHSKNGIMPQITLEEAITKAQHDDYFMNNYGNWKRDESTEDSRPTIYLQGGPNIVNLKFGTIGAFKKQGYNK